MSTSSKGLPMAARWDPEKLARDEQLLRELENRPLLTRIRGYAKLTGPAWLQSAMTLGAGSAAASVMAGASFKYKLLWVQPLAMLLGVVMFAALAKIVLNTGERPYRLFARELSWVLAFLWALGTILASVIWHFPQYGLAGGAAWDLAQVAGAPADHPWLSYVVKFVVAFCILGINIFTVWNYGSHSAGIKLYETFLRWVIRIVIIAFLAVVILSKTDWLGVFWGFFGFYLPSDPKGWTVVLGALGATVGINMTFLYPYSLLAKGWGKYHQGLAKWDLISSMLIPYTIVTSLVIIAMANTVYGGRDVVNTDLKPVQAAAVFSQLMGSNVGRIILDLGFLAMTCGAISTHMVVCGFTVCEMFGLEYTAKRFRLFALTPSIGILGAALPSPLWMPVLASAICLTMLPIAYLAFFLMVNKRSVLGEALGSGPKRWAFNAALIVAIAVTTVGASIKIKTGAIDPIRKWLRPPVAESAERSAQATPSTAGAEAPTEEAAASHQRQ
ncbi:MAG: NRAMP family divalent metal transporter [Thermogutta sp.]